MAMVFDITKGIFQLKIQEELVIKIATPYDIEYRGHSYRIDPVEKTITHVSGDTSQGAMYYGYSYLYEIKNMLTTKLTLLERVVCY